MTIQKSLIIGDVVTSMDFQLFAYMFMLSIDKQISFWFIQEIKCSLLRSVRNILDVTNCLWWSAGPGRNLCPNVNRLTTVRKVYRFANICVYNMLRYAICYAMLCVQKWQNHGRVNKANIDESYKSCNEGTAQGESSLKK